MELNFLEIFGTIVGLIYLWLSTGQVSTFG